MKILFSKVGCIKPLYLIGASIVAGKKLNERDREALSKLQREAMEVYRRSGWTLEKDKIDKETQTTV